MADSIFERDEYKALGERWQARKERFVRNWKYYKAEVYQSRQDGSDIGKYVNQRIADTVLPLFTPLARAVNLDVALIPGGWRLDAYSQQYAAAVGQVLRASRWATEGDKFVRFMVAMGEAGLYVVDRRDEEDGGQAYLQALRPDTYLVQTMSRYDPTPARVFFIDEGVDEEGRPVEEATVIEPGVVRTYVAGEPAGLGDRPPEYANALGFVPVVEAKNDPGDGSGEPTFDDVVASLDQANRQATYLANIIQRHAEPQWAAFGAEAGDLEKSGDAVWFFPEGSDVRAVLAQVDFEGVRQFIEDVKQEVKDALPELAISKLVGVERVAAATIELQLAEAVFKVRRLRKPADQALAEALRLAGRSGLAEAALDDPLLRLDPERPVISLDALTRLQLQQAEAGVQLQQMALEREQLLMGAANGQEESGNA